jgi:hypothetical protein
VLTFGLNTVFDCDGDRIWLTDGYAPFVYDQRDQSLTDLDWPAEVEANVSCICHDEKTVWWGTHGSGLVEMDKQSRRCRVYTEKDGLLLNRITALAVGQGRLWIGFGTKRVGGVGFLDLPSRRFTGMTPELELKSITNANVASLASWKDEPPHGPVLALSPTPAGDLWLYAGEEMVGMKFYSLAQNQWRTIKDCRDPGSKCMVATSNYIAYGKCNYASGLEIYTIPTRQSRGVDVREWLPRRQGSMEDSPIEALFVTASGERVWYGARGFLARADLKTGRVEQICVYDDWFQRRLDGLQCAGDDLWVAADCKLYRVPNRVRETSAAAAR